MKFNILISFMTKQIYIKYHLSGIEMEKQKQDIKQLVKKFVRSNKIKSNWVNKFENQCHQSSECNCGKKKQKYTINPIPLNVHSFTSAYKDSFHTQQQRSLKKLAKYPRIKKSQQKISQQRVIKASSYTDHYSPEKEELANRIRQIRMANNIPLGGPFFNSTTYSNSYNPEKKSQSTEKIKSKDNLVTLSDKFKMYTETSYAKNYQQTREHVKTRPLKRLETLKAQNLPFRGDSTYKNTFPKKLPYESQDKANLVGHKIALLSQSKNKTLSTTGLKMKTSYQNEYDRKIIEKCPSHH